MDEDRIEGHSTQEMAAQASASLLWHTAFGLPGQRILRGCVGSHFTDPRRYPAHASHLPPSPAPPMTDQRWRNDSAVCTPIHRPPPATSPHLDDVSPCWEAHLVTLCHGRCKSTAQARAVPLVANNTSNGIVVLLTGGKENASGRSSLGRGSSRQHRPSDRSQPSFDQQCLTDSEACLASCPETCLYGNGRSRIVPDRGSRNEGSLCSPSSPSAPQSLASPRPPAP